MRSLVFTLIGIVGASNFCRLSAANLTNVLISGQTVTNTVTAGSRTNVYTFEGTSTDVITLRAIITTNGSATAGVIVMRLLGPDGALVAEDVAALTRADKIAFINHIKLPEDGTYQVLVWDGYRGTAVFDYALTIVSGGAPISPGPTVTRAIDQPSHVDAYSFSGFADDLIAVRAVRTINRSSPPAVIMVEVIGPDGSVVASDLGALIRADAIAFSSGIRLPGDGLYQILVWDGNQGTASFEYALSMVSGGAPISPGQTITAAINEPSHIGAYSFSGLANDLIAVRALRTTNRSSPPAVIVVEVIGPDGSVVASDLGALIRADATAFIQGIRLPDDGLYQILVWDGYQGTASFNYSMTLTGSGAPILPGQSVTGEIHEPAEVDVFSFAGSSNDVVTVLAVLTTNRNANTGVIVIDLIGPDGAVAASDVQLLIRPDRTAFINDFRLSADGGYKIMVWDGYLGTANFDYTLSFIKNSGPNIPSPDGGQITSGETLAGTVEVGDLDFAEFYAGPCQYIELTLTNITGGRSKPVMELQSPEGDVLAVDSGNSFVRMRVRDLPTNGTYLVVLRDNEATNTFDYRITMKVLSPAIPTMTTSGPLLVISTCSNGVTVSWLTNAIDYELQASSDLSSVFSWFTIPGPYGMGGQQFFFNEPIVYTNKFYRLRHP